MTTLTILMKSGSKIKLRFIKEYEVKTIGNRVNFMRIVRWTLFGRPLPGTKLLVTTIDLDQVEAVLIS